MHKVEFCDRVAADYGCTKKMAAEAFDMVFQTLYNVLTEGEELSVVDFGKFALVNRSPRTARDMHTQELIQIPAKKAVKFKPGKHLKEAVAGL